MSFWKKLSAWANHMEAQAERRKADRRVLRNATYVDLKNSLDVFGGEIAKMLDTTGSIIVQKLGDFSKVVRDQLNAQQEWIENSFRLYDNMLTSTLRTYNEAAELRHEESRLSLDGIAKYLMAMGRNQDDRYIQLTKRLEMLEARSEYYHGVEQGTTIGLFENLTDQIQAQGQTPRLQWLLDNVEELISFCNAMQKLRDNTEAPQNVIADAVRSVRSIVEVSTAEAQEGIDDIALRWGVAA